MIVTHLPFVRAIVLRAALLWLGVRLSIMVLPLLALASPLLPTGALESALIIGATVALCFVELRRRGELLFLANLGSSPQSLLLLSAVPLIPLEVAFTLLVLGL